MRAAKTLAAFEGKKEVAPEEILRVAEMTLSHRTRRGGFEEPASPEEIHKVFSTALEETYKE